jgi:hypothetical protein
MSVSFRAGGTWDWRPPLAIVLPSMTLLAFALCTSAAAQDASDEYRLKAGFLYRFPQFVEWPAHVIEGRATVDICVVGPNPFGDVLEELVEGEHLDGRGLRVRHPEGNQFDDCHILYLPRTQARRREILRRLTEAPVLTVSDAPTFLDEGGMIQLFLRDNRLRFSINAAATERARIRLSAQLLRLAQTVRRRPS